MPSEPRIVTIIQARTSSTRLPGKVLMDLAGDSLLARVVTRTSRCPSIGELIVATTTGPEDEPIVALCAARGWTCFRGSRDDVLDRYYRAALEHGAEVVVRICSDCPLIDPGLLERLIGTFLALPPAVDYLGMSYPRRRLPIGLDAEVFRFEALERAWREDPAAASREHVTNYIICHPEIFRLEDFVYNGDYSGMRWTVDTREDYALIRRIYEHFGHDRFTWHEVLNLLAAHAEWLELNRHVPQKTV
jgi:spore coat polysaccharide biosynthesis protein SpsF